MSNARRHYADLIQACFDAYGKNSLIPPQFRRWTAISMIAGIMGRKCWYDFGAFKVYPNMFIALVAEPGRGKSLSLGLPFDTEDGICAELSEAIGTKEDKWRKSFLEYGMKRPMFLVQDRITPERLSIDMKNSCVILDELGTVDKMPKQSAVTMITSEFGNFMNRNDHYLQMFMTDMWDSRSLYSYRTKTAGIDTIEGPCLNWITCATPEQFVANMPENARSQGLLSRLLVIYYDGVQIDRSTKYESWDRDQLRNLREDLAAISNLAGEFNFSDDQTHAVVEAWVRGGMLPAPTDPNMREYNERRLSQLMKVMMVVSAARSDARLITLADFETARELLLEAEEAMPRALQKFGVTEVGRSAMELAELVKDSPKGIMPYHKFTKAVLGKVRSPGEVRALLDNMQEAGLIRITERNVVYVKEKEFIQEGEGT